MANGIQVQTKAGRPRPSGAEPELDAVLAAAAERVDSELDRILPVPQLQYGRVQEAMRYAVFSGGKRVRPLLTMQCAGLFGVRESISVRTAAAIELLHCYSLVHDDLPCMDDDDLRRGRPTVHRRFDEATAVLAGDGLLTLAFQTLASHETHSVSSVRCELIAGLGAAVGSDGMVGGQMMDMLASGQFWDVNDVTRLQAMKTGALFQFSCEAGAILAQADNDDRARLRDFGHYLGASFQIADDLVDATGNQGKAGKAVGKDAAQGKATLISLVGLRKARALAYEYAERAAQELDGFGENAASLCELPFYLLNRIP